MKTQLTQPEGSTLTMTAFLAPRSSRHVENGMHDDGFARQATMARAFFHTSGTQYPRSNRPRVLVAEDDDNMRRVLVRVLLYNGYTPVECRDGFDLYRHLEPLVVHGFMLDFDAIVSDILMPGPTGLDILNALHDRPGFPPMILITGFGDKGIYAQAQRAGAAAVLQKPFGTNDLISKLQEIAPHRCGKERDL